ncbi:MULTISPECIES: hypothetical protein [unclassified Thalassospira]|uniref:hypothetical protein n=1 Tax=unclassified Thalassospira TaxID=2648997 RepID=UPI001B079DFD|nr:hypothetical protein [Thalassospira sp.]MBO6772387.1 hypothetical protein [Thalassospira sp.]
MTYKVPFYSAVISALITVWIGLQGPTYVASCSSSLCNGIRSLEWETLTAGLLGLAGGLAVVWATQTQIVSQRKAAVDLELIDIDSFTKELSERLKEIISTVEDSSRSVIFDDAESAGKANIAVENAVGKVETALLFNIDSNHRFPASLRQAARIAYEQTVLPKTYRFAVTRGRMDYTAVSSTQHALEEWVQHAHEPLEELIFERNKYAQFLINR